MRADEACDFMTLRPPESYYLALSLCLRRLVTPGGAVGSGAWVKIGESLVVQYLRSDSSPIESTEIAYRRNDRQLCVRSMQWLPGTYDVCV